MHEVLHESTRNALASVYRYDYVYVSHMYTYVLCIRALVNALGTA